jgi:uncharacterized protein
MGTIYLLSQKLSPTLFVGTTVVFFAATNFVKLIPYGYLGLLRVGNIWTSLLLAPLCYLGIRLGIYLNRHFSEICFKRIICAGLFLTGIQLIMGKSLIDVLFK